MNKREFYIDYDENGGEYTGHMRLETTEKVTISGKHLLKIGNTTVIKFNEEIAGADEWIENKLRDVIDELKEGQ